jgi:hypothetical protein
MAWSGCDGGGGDLSGTGNRERAGRRGKQGRIKQGGEREEEEKEKGE